MLEIQSKFNFVVFNFVDKFALSRSLFVPDLKTVGMEQCS